MRTGCGNLVGNHNKNTQTAQFTLTLASYLSGIKIIFTTVSEPRNTKKRKKKGEK